MKVEAGKEGKVLFAVLVVLALAGMLIVIYGTRWGPWAFSDAVGYMVNARNLATGKGLGLYRPSGQFVPLVSHPPLYPLILIALSGPQLDLVGAARIFDVISFGMLIFASGWLFYRLTGSAWAATAIAGVFLVQPALIHAYTSAMSEPLFLLTSVTGSLLLLTYLDEPKPSRLIWAGVVTGMAFMTRYTGAAILGAGTVCLMLFDQVPIKNRLAHSAVYGFIASLPVGTFVAWSRIRYSGATPRGIRSEFDFGPQVIAFFRQIPQIIYSWKPLTADMLNFPGIESDALRAAGKPVVLILGLALALLIILTVGRIRPMLSSGNLRASTLRALAMFVLMPAAYLAFFGVAYVITSPTPDVDGRTILPILPAIIIAAITVVYLLVQAWPERPWGRLVAALLIVGSIAGYASISSEPLDSLHQNGSGYTSPMWRKSETVKAVMGLSPDIPLISNEPIAVLFYVGRWPHELTVTGESGDSASFTHYGDGGDEMESIFRDQHAALILFKTISAQIAGRYKDETQARVEALTAGLTRAFQGSDGAIYFYP